MQAFHHIGRYKQDTPPGLVEKHTGISAHSPSRVEGSARTASRSDGDGNSQRYHSGPERSTKDKTNMLLSI